MSDLVYIQNGFYTRFLANTPEGEQAYNEIVRVTGDNAIRNDHVKAVLKQLRKAGYKVTKAKVSNKSKESVLSEIDDILRELDL